MLIQLKDVFKIYSEGLESEVRALDGVSLTLDRGEFVAVVGQSGSGKSTMMNVLGCLDIPTRGDYLLDGVDVRELTDKELSHIRNKQIGFIFQQYNLIQALTVLENVELPLIYQGINADTRQDMAMEALERVGLKGRHKHKPAEMSGGQQQRVAIARAIVARPPIIMADEPTGALDSHTGHEVLGFLQQFNREGSTIILITHDSGIAATARRIVRLTDGKIVEDKEQEVDWAVNIKQAVKMAWKSILGKKGRSFLTMLGIIIGIASVMTIVAVMNGMNEITMKQFEAMGRNRITVSVYSNMYDEQGNPTMPSVFDDLYNYCNGLTDYVLGVTPTSYCSATVVYGTKNSANMQPQWNEDGTMSGEQPPNLCYGSDQYSICNNFEIEKGRDLSYLDIKNYNQICVLGARAAKVFFDYADPVGKEIQANGQSFLVVGVYAEKDPDSNWSQDNVIVFPYTASRVLGGGANMTEFLVKAKSADAAIEASSRLSGFLSGLIKPNQGGYSVQSDNQWQDSSNEWTTMMGLVLGGIAAISLLVGGIGIMNIMLVTVTERTREIGIRRAIGAERSSIVTQFLIEAAMICGIGGVVGIGVGTLGSMILGKLLLKMTIYPAAWITVCAFLLSVALGILFGIFPAVKASKLQPVEALRAE